MKWKIENEFLANYILMFFISIMIGFFALMLMDFADDVISKTLVKNNYPAESLMEDDYNQIDIQPVIANGGGVQVINQNHEIVLSEGLNTLNKSKLTTAEFTEFLTESKSLGVPYSYDISYNSQEKFWLLVTFPTSIRIDFAIVQNQSYPSVDRQHVVGVLVAIFLFYLILLGICTLIYSKLTSFRIVKPLKELTASARRLRDGNYSERVDLHLRNEFAELEDTFNTMAERIEQEISLRKQSEEERKNLILDISHDLKNPLASIMGYAELCRNKPELTEEQRNAYLNVICENSIRANRLITDLFELSKVESSEFTIHKEKVDICEYLREEISKALPVLEQAGLTYEFDIPEQEILVMLDTQQMNRVLQNLVTNTTQYNSPGTKVEIKLWELDQEVIMIFKDNGIGIPADLSEQIFKPFIRADQARNSQTGGTGLGLAIVKKIIEAHGGRIHLKTDQDIGCEFIISLPKVQ